MALINENGLFSILNLDVAADWDILPRVAPYVTCDALTKIRDFLLGKAKGIIIEKRYVDKDYRDTFSGFYSKKFAEYPSRTIRLHFFTESLTSDDLFRLATKQDKYIGFSVIRPTRVNCIGRTVFDPAQILGLQGNLCQAIYRVHILGSELKVCGFPYISQDSDVTVCAHAASWMVFRYFSEKYSIYSEAYPYEISQMTADQSHGRLIPSKGLTVFQLSEMFTRFGFFPEIYLRDALLEAGLFDRLLYYYLESGLPVVAGMSKERHAISLFGHVSDYKQQLPRGSIAHSADYVTGWIGNDDNHMPYQVFPKFNLGAEKLFSHRSTYNMANIDAFVVPLHDKIHLSAEHVEKLTVAILENPQYGLKSLCPGIAGQDIVVRVFLTSSKSYKEYRRAEQVTGGINQLYLQLPMPRFIWVSELSTRALYPHGKVVGEIIWDSTANQYDRYPFLVIHYPTAVIANDRDAMTEDQNRFPINYSLPEGEPYAIFRGNLRGSV